MLLKVGSTGEDVKKLQTFLGVDAGSAFGTFGPKTEAAVKAWQKKNGLLDDGIVGDATWSKMFPVKEQTTSGGLNLSALKGHIPDSVIAQIPDTASKFGITTNLRLAHFLSQCAHESGSFSLVNENLNYSASGLKKTFPNYFPGNLADSYARKPEAIASRVYGNRMGNGNEESRDGWKYRGRGYIQLTGKSNYTSFSKFIGEDTINNPDLVASKYPLSSAAFFFQSNNLWAICDKGSDEATVTAVTKRVNGGTNGLSDRLKHFNEFYAALTKS